MSHSHSTRDSGVRVWVGERFQRHYKTANCLDFQIPLPHILDFIYSKISVFYRPITVDELVSFVNMPNGVDG